MASLDNLGPPQEVGNEMAAGGARSGDTDRPNN
jgi:hypothetical protein